ncbi:hypothetical protein EV130_110208 [Rhizobium azibense]|uniref:Uncharacterized protein n=1 Tax=Rhizobium azibense TaxID=1136135 RepID=A0A4R3QJ14_9HYPH|nr:hypothetical protein EV130_110208 [Rhizobium azibense]
MRRRALIALQPPRVKGEALILISSFADDWSNNGNGRASARPFPERLAARSCRQPILMSLPSLTDWTAASASTSAARPSAPEGEIVASFSTAAMKLAISLA